MPVTPLAPHRFFAAGIARRDDGVLMTDCAIEAPTADDAVTLAQFVACQPGWCGAWAYAAVKNPRTGQCEPIETLARFGLGGLALARCSRAC
jgi:hypothetical protein